MELPQSNTQTPVYSYTRTELLSLGTKTSLLSLSTVDRLKDLSIGYHLPRRHRSSQGVKRKKQNLHPFIVASFNAQSVKGNDIIIIMVIFKCYFSGEHIVLSIKNKKIKNNNCVNMELGKTNRLKALSMMQINT